MRRCVSRIFMIPVVVFMILVFGLQDNSFALGFQEEAVSTAQRFAGIPRPDPEGIPTKVSVGIVILDVTNFDDVGQTFTVDFYFI